MKRSNSPTPVKTPNNDKLHTHTNTNTNTEHASQQAIATLRQAGLKRTPHRERILQFLIQNHGPFSKEEIQEALEGGLPSSELDGVTLYRNLSHFEAKGILRRTEFGDGISRYEYQQCPDQHHHHVRCTQCHKVESLASCKLPKLETIVRQLGYSNIKHSLEFFGICSACFHSSKR